MKKSVLGLVQGIIKPPVPRAAEKSPAKVMAYIKPALGYVAKKGLVMLVAYLFGRAGALFGTYPFGIALLSGVSRDIIFIYAGLLMSVPVRSTSDAGGFFFLYTSCLALRYAFSKWVITEKENPTRKKLIGEEDTEEKEDIKVFEEPLSLRIVSVLLCSLSLSLARLIADGFLYYDLFSLIVSVTAAPFLCFMYYTLSESKNVPKQLYEIAVAVGIYSVIYSITPYYVLGFSAGIISSLLVTLYSSHKFGSLRGAIVGMFAGLACDSALAPMFAIAGFASGVLYNISLFAAVGSAGLCCLLFGVSQNGFAAFSTLLPELAATSAVFLPLAYYDVLPDVGLFKSNAYVKSRETEQALISRAMLEDSTEALETVSQALDGLSQTVAMLSDRLRRPDILDLKDICEQSFEKHCEKCSLAPVCYGKEAVATFDVIGKFTQALDKRGRIELADVPEYVGEKCYNILKIMSDANILYSKHLERLIKDDKTSIFAIDYKAMSKLIMEASKINDREYNFDRDSSTKLVRAIRYMDFDADGVYVYGERRKKVVVTGINFSQVKMGASDIRRAFENIMQTRLTMPVFSIDDDRVTMSLSGEKCYNAKYAAATTKMESSDSNGDSSRFFENKEDKLYFLITDGMGSGREAALTSRLCTMFLSKLLSAGCDSSIVIEMLNGFIRSRSGECSASVDLAELDLVSGKGSLIKSGAAPSYILRGKNLYKLQSKTLPIGILKDTDAEVIDFELQEGDIIVMFSDGVASSLEDGAWLASMLCFEFGEDLDEMAKRILEEAQNNNQKCDDMTVGLIKIEKVER